MRWDSYLLAAAEYKSAWKNAKDTSLNHTLPAMLINIPKRFGNVNNDTTASLLTSPDGVSFPSDECANNVFAVVFSCDVSCDNCDYPVFDALFINPVFLGTCHSEQYTKS